jgi:hypothetical protein
VGGAGSTVMRGRGAVSIGGDAAGGIVVVVVATVVLDAVVDEAVDEVVDVVGFALDDEQAPAKVTTPRSATHRPRLRRTAS